MLIRDLKKRLLDNLENKLGNETRLGGIAIEEPRNKDFGDLSTNAAMVLAPVMKKNPMDIAQVLADEVISGWDEVEDISIAKPGFINFKLKPGYLVEALKEIVKDKESYGKNDSGRKIKVQLEYVSSNPTGDLHIGHGRWGALGDALANIYRACGYDVQTEYYVNDHGSQAEKFTQCAEALYLEHFKRQADYPEDGYPREIVSVAVEKLIKKYQDSFLLERPKPGSAGEEPGPEIKDMQEKTGDGKGLKDSNIFKQEIIKIMAAYIGQTLGKMGVEFDRWFYESSLYEGDNFERTIKDLKERDLVYDDEGALWFRSSRFGDEKDRVVVRGDGNPTYFASDIMYLESKAERGFDRILYILGADHHGYVDRLVAIGKALGIEEGRLEIIIGQLVNIVKDGQAIKMSRRKGKLYTLRDLVEEVGKDAVRYFFSSVSFDTPMDFDIGLAKQRSNQNPVYYIQYAHARIESIFKKIRGAAPVNMDPSDMSLEKFDYKGLELKSDSEKQIAKTLVLYPDMVYSSCTNNAPYIITQYLFRLATEFHHFYNKHRILKDTESGPVVEHSRLGLILLVQRVLVNA
ncbi:MAG: arginine--tRNA ligase, partial [Actinomycetia bacterium]|nr:arginine--tRNA ligase [Actinomycetes bacterium]